VGARAAALALTVLLAGSAPADVTGGPTHVWDGMTAREWETTFRDLRSYDFAGERDRSLQFSNLADRALERLRRIGPRADAYLLAAIRVLDLSVAHAAAATLRLFHPEASDIPADSVTDNDSRDRVFKAWRAAVAVPDASLRRAMRIFEPSYRKLAQSAYRKWRNKAAEVEERGELASSLDRAFVLIYAREFERLKEDFERRFGRDFVPESD